MASSRARVAASRGFYPNRRGKLADHRSWPSDDRSQLPRDATELSDFDQAEERLLRFRGLGIRIALDDFGTGYSSLAYLRRLPLDAIKIDRSFARDISSDRQGQDVIRAIIQLARALNLAVVTEGVETESQALRLTGCGCSVLQGYLFGRPMPLPALMQVLEAPSNLVVSRAG